MVVQFRVERSAFSVNSKLFVCIKYIEVSLFYFIAICDPDNNCCTFYTVLKTVASGASVKRTSGARIRNELPIKYKVTLIFLTSVNLIISIKKNILIKYKMILLTFL